MRQPGTPTLDQLTVFLAVVEAGGLAAAARRLGRATSAISYAIDGLEAQLGLALFDRGTTRAPKLTAAGSAVVAEARRVGDGVASLRARVAGLLGGLEAEVSLAVDVMFPTARLVGALHDFREAYPTVNLRLHVEALGAVATLVLAGEAAFGVAGPINAATEGGLERIDAGGITMLPVAAPGHPLAQGPQPPGAAREHVQLVLSDRSTVTEGQDFGVVAANNWRLSDLGAKHALLRHGLGWGNMPEAMVADDLAAGRLVALDLADWRGASYRMQVIYRTEAPPGPATRWLIERLVEGAA
ncbi:LysR family transcriptional regulator [Sphingosinicellaceae bacterium]|nr:LysR family transcriptional regulator [Sphingosinicellaceae bacterium]